MAAIRIKPMPKMLLIAALFLATDLSAQIPKSYTCHRAGAPIQIDGNLNDPAWKHAPWTHNFLDIEGTNKPKPRFRTRAKILWDDQYLYIAAELQEPHVWATLTAHDSVIFHDNDFEVFLDPNGDTLNYYEFEINALNTSWDLFLDKPYRFGGKADNSWNIPDLKTAVAVLGTLNNPADLDRGWTIEIALPWKAFAEHAGTATPPNPGDTWRVNFSRVEWKHEITNGTYHVIPGTKEDNWVWSPQGTINMHIPEHWGYVRFAP